MAAMDFPVPTYTGQQYSNGTTTWQWDGTAWNIVPQPGPMYIGDTPPSNPAAGQQWFRSSNCCLYVWYNDGNSSQWVQSQGSNAAPGIWELANPVYDLAGKTQQVFKDLDAYRRLRLHLEFVPSAAATAYYQTSVDNGATFAGGATDYVNSDLVQAGTTVQGLANGNGSSMILSSNNMDANFPYATTTEISYFNKPNMSWFKHNSNFVMTGAVRREFPYGYRNSPVAFNAFRLGINAGTFVSGFAVLEGIRG